MFWRASSKASSIFLSSPSNCRHIRMLSDAYAVSMLKKAKWRVVTPALFVSFYSSLVYQKNSDGSHHSLVFMTSDLVYLWFDCCKCSEWNVDRPFSGEVQNELIKRCSCRERWAYISRPGNTLTASKDMKRRPIPSSTIVNCAPLALYHWLGTI
jgi:hypothetical protein